MQDASEVLVGASGAFQIAPTGTALPTFISDPLDAAFVDVGLLTTEGVSIDPETSQEVVRSWQRLTRTRTLITERDFAIAFMMQQWNETTLPFTFGGGSVVEPNSGTNPGEYEYDFPDTDVVDQRTAAITWVDGSKNYRLLIPVLEVADVDEINLVRNSEAKLGVTCQVISDPAAAYTMLLQTDDPSMAP